MTSEDIPQHTPMMRQGCIGEQLKGRYGAA